MGPRLQLWKRMVCFGLLGGMLLGMAGCGQNAPSSQPAASAPSVPVSLPAPEPEPEPLYPAYLTGAEKTADYPEGQRICAVMVVGDAGARPVSGINTAKIVVEAEVEYNMPRMMFLFEDYTTMPKVGPIRSARDQFFQLLLPSWPLYIHDGPAESTSPVNLMIDAYDFWEFNLDSQRVGGFTYRDPSRVGQMKLEYTEYTDGDRVANIAEKRDIDPHRDYEHPMFHFVPYNEPPRVPEDGRAAYFEVPHPSSYYSVFEYDGEARQYDVYRKNGAGGALYPAVDESDGQQAAFDNVVVLFAAMDLYPNSALPRYDYTSGGGVLFTQGGYEVIIWMKGGPDDPLRLYNIDRSGDQVELNVGRTYINIIRDSKGEDFLESLKGGAG